MRLLADRGLGRRTLIMGVLNVTPDSFSDGGTYFNPAIAVARAFEMLDQGADILDVGGESTRPATFGDNAPLDAREELRRVAPVIEAVHAKRPDAIISVDTYKAVVAKAAVDAGASIVNDVSGLVYDPEMAGVVAQSGAGYVLMHILGTPRNIPANPVYADVIADIHAFFVSRIEFALANGIAREQLILDPGLGFGKTAAHNFEIVRRLRELTDFGLPILSAPSRKAFIGKALGGVPADQRVEGTAAVVALSIAGGADIVRVHDVAQMVRVARVADAVVRGWAD
ncbi:MAG: dihydropteroate synthase [Capsulimonadaceae bacterium]|nr:dihydropteroate synthase [Capsulimonadaceae bacterium]